ncbi:MAG: sulfate transporter CysZ [Gammaproteobacteria bacterium]
MGAHYLLRGFKLILQPGLRRFVIMPLLVNTLIFVLLIGLGINQFDRLTNWMLAFLPAWMNWLEWLLWPLFALLTLVFSFFSFSLIANLIGAPFNGVLAEAVEQHLTGRKIENQPLLKTLLQLVPMLFRELLKIVYFLLWAVPFLILFLIPGINLFAPFLWMLFSAWMLALQYLDYPMGNHGLSFAEQRKKLRDRRFNSLGFGGATLLATLIPVVNFLVMPAAVAGATIMWVELFDKPVTQVRI